MAAVGYTNLGQNSTLFGGDDLYSAVSDSLLFWGSGTVLVSDNITGMAYSFQAVHTMGSTTAAFIEDRNGNRVTLAYPDSTP